MVNGTYRDLFVAIAGAAGALTGLLFVALSVAPRPRIGQHPNVIRQVRAAAALVAFTNALAVSLFGLVPHNLIGYPAAVAGAVGLLFVFGGLRSILADPASRQRVRSQIGLILLLLAAFGVEVIASIIAAANPHEKVPIAVIGNVLVASLLIGVARSWELVGDRDTGISASIAALAGHERHLGGSVAGPGRCPRDDDAPPRGSRVARGGSVARRGSFTRGRSPAGRRGPAGGSGPAGGRGPAGGSGPAGGRGPAGGSGPAGGRGPAGGSGPAGGRSPAGRCGWPPRPGGRCPAVLPRRLSARRQAKDAFRSFGCP